MKNNIEQSALIALYREIPEVKGCKAGCSDCCGVVPLSKQEQVNLGINQQVTTTAEQLKNGCHTCGFFAVSGCSNYENRPFMCRLFAAVDDNTLKCPHGAKADKPLSEKRAKILLRRYKMLIKDSEKDINVILKDLTSDFSSPY